jgi:hypothetical protein
MRIASLTGPVITLATIVAFGCGIEQLSQGGSSAAASDAGAGDGGDSGVLGAGCGIESGSGQQLCVATSLCPNVVVDTEAMPHCGFRIKGSSSELVCGCGDSICSMGAFTTCTQAAALLQSQSEGAVCAQVGEGRCSVGKPSTSSSSSSSSSSGSTCDRSCLQECGSGAGCASICGC